MTSVHKGKKPFKCHICDLSFKCGTCNKDFTSDKDLRQLVNSVHEGKKPLKCDICVAYFADKYKLKRHVLSVHEEIK